MDIPWDICARVCAVYMINREARDLVPLLCPCTAGCALRDNVLDCRFEFSLI